MEIKDRMSEIRARAGEESAKNISPLLDTLQSDYTDKLDTVNRLHSETLRRKEKIIEIEQDRDDLKVKNEILKKDLEDDSKLVEANKKVNELLEFQTTVHNQNRVSFKTKYEVVSQHENYDKIKSVVSVPLKEGSETEHDYEKIEDAQVTVMLAKINEYADLGLFGDPKKPDNVVLTPKTPTGGAVDFSKMSSEEMARDYPKEFKEQRRGEIKDKKWIH